MRKEILYVPLLKTLEVMLSNKSIQREVLNCLVFKSLLLCLCLGNVRSQE